MRAHPTVRPHALALGVLPQRSAMEDLAFLGPAVAQDLAAALLLDTLGALSTFPVRHRVVFTHGADPILRSTRLPATWRDLAQRGGTCTERAGAAFDDLLALGAEAVLLITADGPMLPLGPMFDGIMWVLSKRRVVVGPVEGGGVYAFGAAERIPVWEDLKGPMGLGERTPGLSEAIALELAHSSVNSLDQRPGPKAEYQLLPASYRVSDYQSLARLKRDIEQGLFAPQVRKFFEKTDLSTIL